ncbi:MAG: hypothetical protein J6S60_04815 [Oscillospiraceae bacterium]|nr:hypothetical protein [Oscillospiraceae bacterium]
MDTRTIRVMINTLNRIQVSGEENMNMLLGCIQLMKNELNQAEAEQEENHEEIHSAE